MHGSHAGDWTAARVKALRMRLGLSQERFAARIGTTGGTVCRWEMGVRRPMPMACELLLQLEAVEGQRNHGSVKEG